MPPPQIIFLHESAEFYLDLSRASTDFFLNSLTIFFGDILQAEDAMLTKPFNRKKKAQASFGWHS